MEKAPDAFRTISEVAEVLDTPAHVLRFWESRFPQIRPVKRAGGRRYYRPSDVALLAGIRLMLHDQGLTIRGVQKVLRESGVRHVQAMARGKVEGFAEIGEVSEIEAALKLTFLSDVEPEILVARSGAEIVSLPRPARSGKAVAKMRKAAAPPANVPFFAEDVPEAPFIEAEEEAPAKADVLHLTQPGPSRRAKKAPVLEDELPLLARMAEWDAADEALQAENMAEEDLADLAAMDGVSLGEAQDEPEETDTDARIAAMTAADDVSPQTGRMQDFAATPLGSRLRALPRPVSPEATAAFAPLLARALELQTLLAAATQGRD